MFGNNRKKENNRINLSEKEQVELTNVVYKNCNNNMDKILDEFEKWKWMDYVKPDDPHKLFYYIIIIELYIYQAILRRTYNKEVCTNILITILDEYSKKFEEDSDSFVEQAFDDMLDMDDYLNEAVSTGSDIYFEMFLYLISNSCNVPYEVFMNPKEVLPMFVMRILNDMANNFSEVIEEGDFHQLNNEENLNDNETEEFICDNCGAKVHENARQCPKCGLEFEIEEEIEEEEFVCDNCGSIVKETDTKCPKCGLEFE